MPDTCACTSGWKGAKCDQGEKFNRYHVNHMQNATGSFYTPAPREGGILFYLCPSVHPRYFSLHFSQQLLMAEI